MYSGVHNVRSTLILVSIAVGVGCLSVLVIGQNINATNVTGNISSTASGVKNNTVGNTATNNNVTAAAGNNGHIYRGGAAAGSGGE
jgi:hypothetical protein